MGGLLVRHCDRFEKKVALRIPRLAKASEWLRGEREISFYGDVDFIPTEEYTRKQGLRAISEARVTVQTARWVIRPPRSRTTPSKT